jgi:hypothetical protein
VHPQDLIEQMKESIPQRRFVETTEAFCELLTRGYPLRQAVKDVLDAGAPYTHLPYHVSIQNGRPYKISNDHCLLDTRAALYLMRYMPPETHLLPVVQSVWYWPQGLDVWGQTKLEGWSGDTTDTILGLIDVLKARGTPRYPTSEDWRVYPPSQRYYVSEGFCRKFAFSRVLESVSHWISDIRFSDFGPKIEICDRTKKAAFAAVLSPTRALRT